MPHRVSTFFRHHAYSVDLPAESKQSSRRSSSSKLGRPALSERSLSSSNTSLSSNDNMDNLPGAIKRLSLPGRHSKSSSKSAPQITAATLAIAIESPPVVFYGTIANSSGALLSGQLKVMINEDHTTIEEFKMRMVQEVRRKRAFHGHCKDCERQSTELNDWNFSHGPMTLKRGEHSFPFSFLLPGKLPASMKGMLSEIEYALRATIKTTSGDISMTSHVLDVKRAVHPGVDPRQSVRIFPPTNIVANCELPTVIYPIGQSSLTMRIDGVVKREGKTQTQWKLKRLTWRLDETHKMSAPACAKHVAKLGKDVTEAKKTIAHQEVRTLGFEELKNGWKGDYETANGEIQFEFPFGIKADQRPICDIKAEDGTEVSHMLVVEMIVTEEFTPIGKPKNVTPTGAARVLRMHFNIVVTERAGLGISWDEEAPPTYGDVPASPPRYGQSEEINDFPGLPDYEDLAPLDSPVEGESHEL